MKMEKVRNAFRINLLFNFYSVMREDQLCKKNMNSSISDEKPSIIFFLSSFCLQLSHRFWQIISARTALLRSGAVFARWSYTNVNLSNPKTRGALAGPGT